MIFAIIQKKKIFARELVRHLAGIVDSYSLKVSALPNFFCRYLAPPNTISSNTPKASGIPLSEWKTNFLNEFDAPDSKYEFELYEFLCVYPKSHYGVTMQVIITAVSKLKRKVSSSINNISAYHVIHGTPLLMQMIFDTFTLPSSFCIGDLIPIPNKGKSNIQCSTFRPTTIFATFCKLFELLFVDELKQI